MQYLIPFSTKNGLRRKRLWLEISSISAPTNKFSSLFNSCAIFKLVLILSSSIQVLHADDVIEDHENLSSKMATSAFDVVPDEIISRSNSAYQTNYDNLFVAITTFNPGENSKKVTKSFAYRHDSTKDIIDFSYGPQSSNQVEIDVKKPLALAINVSTSQLEKIRNSPSINVKDQSQFYNTTVASSNIISESVVSDETAVVNKNIQDKIIDMNQTAYQNSSIISCEIYNTNTTVDLPNETSIIATVVKAAILITIIIAALFSNLLVVISVSRYRKLRHINNYFLVSLAIADMFVASFAMFFSASSEITGRWNFGYRICDLYNSLDVHFSTVSTLHLCCIAIDRYYAIVRPLKYSTNMTVHVAAAMIGIAWTAPTLISFLPIFLGWYTTNEHLNWRRCHPDECLLKANVPYALLSSTLTFWLPVTVMLVMYHRVYKEAQRQKMAMQRTQVLQANGFKGLRNGGGNTKKRNSSDGSSTSGLTNTGCLNAISNNTKNVNFLPTSKMSKLQSSISIGQIHSSSTANSKLNEQLQNDKKLIRSTMDENDSELETLMVPMLDSSPGGKKSFRIENTDEISDLENVDSVDNSKVKKRNITEVNGSTDSFDTSQDIKHKPLPTPGVKITLPSPCDGSPKPGSYPKDSSINEAKSDITTSSQEETSEEPLLANTNNSNQPTNPNNEQLKSVLKRQPPPLPPRGVLTNKPTDNCYTPTSKSSGVQTNVPSATLPINHLGPNAMPRLSAESTAGFGGMAGSLTPRRLSVAASSLSEDANNSTTSISSENDKIISKQEQKNCKKRLSDHESDRMKELLEDSFQNEKNGNKYHDNDSTNPILRKLSCSNNSIYTCSNNHTTFQYDSINRSATTNDVHFLIRENSETQRDKNNEHEGGSSAITAKTPFLSDSQDSKPTKYPSSENQDEGERKGVNFGTTATVLVATTKLKSCLKNPLRKKKKHSEGDLDGSKKLKKKESKKHICWENENLIQNEEDGRGMQSKILNMAIVASGPAFLHGGGLNPESRRSSNPETPLITDSAAGLDFNPQRRKSSLLVDSLNAISRTSSTTTLTNTRRRSSVMVTSLVKSLDKLGLRERHRIHTSWRKEHKAFVTLGIVMGAFLLCWLPFFTWYLTVTACGDYCFDNCPPTLVSILFWIGYFNSTLNPVIYVMTNRDFKDAFKDILKKTFCWCCPTRTDDGFPISSSGVSGGGAGGGFGGPLPNTNPDRLNVDYV